MGACSLLMGLRCLRFHAIAETDELHFFPCPVHDSSLLSGSFASLLRYNSRVLYNDDFPFYLLSIRFLIGLQLPE